MAVTKKILLVEDDGFTRFMMREIRDTLGVDIDIAESADDGVQRYELNPASYGVVLMDCTAPDETGLTASQTIRDSSTSDCSVVPIIAVTANDNMQDDLLLSAHGMNGVLRKPITPGEVMELVDTYCKVGC